jgi:hypothetical protein
MQRGRGGMGSHKHGTSGRATKSPRLRMREKLEAERRAQEAQDQHRYGLGVPGIVPQMTAQSPISISPLTAAQ